MSKNRKSPSTRASRAGTGRKVWNQIYRQRISDGLEACRNCRVVRTDLTFGHLCPAADGHGQTFDNSTILCVPCNCVQGSEVWPHLVSLAAEESAAPPDRQWTNLAARREHQVARQAYLAAEMMKQGVSWSSAQEAIASVALTKPAGWLTDLVYDDTGTATAQPHPAQVPYRRMR